MAKKQNEKQINPADDFVDPATMLDQAANPGDESIDDGTQEVVRVGVISVPVVPVFPPIAAPVEAPRIVDLVDVNLCVPLLADADDAPKETTPNELAMRLCVPSQTLRICPHWVRFLTRASDVQCPDNEFQFWWEVWGWGLGGRGTMIDYGVNDRQGLANEIRTRFYDHADGGPKLRPQITLIDSGNHANDMYGFCREFRGVLPCKGSSSSTFPTLFKIGGIEKSGATSDRDLQIRLGGLALLEVNHEKTNWWVENSITGLVKPDDPFGVSFPSEMAMDEDFWRQWASEYPVNGKNDNGYDIHEWKKRHRNEWRDAGRYNLVAAAYQTNYGQRFNTLPPRMTKDQIEAAALDASRRQTEQQSGLTTPDGRPFFVTNR